MKHCSSNSIPESAFIDDVVQYHLEFLFIKVHFKPSLKLFIYYKLLKTFYLEDEKIDFLTNISYKLFKTFFEKIINIKNPKNIKSFLI